MIIIIIA